MANEMRRQACYRPIAFAAPLYEIVARQYSVTVSFLHDRGGKERPSSIFGGASPRQLLQAAGDALRSRDGEDVLIERLRAHIEAEPSVRFVITDLRLPGEADAVRAMGATVVRVLWSGAHLKGDTAKHRTEADDFEPDLTVVNDATPEEVVAGLLASLVTQKAVELA